jgi:hypothetical protein
MENAFGSDGAARRSRGVLLCRMMVSRSVLLVSVS